MHWNNIYIIKERGEALSNDRVLLKEIGRTREAVRATIVRGKDRTSSNLWKSFELHYAKDLEVGPLYIIIGKEGAFKALFSSVAISRMICHIYWNLTHESQWVTGGIPIHIQ